ncbi:MAG: hypothetical protein FWG17_01820 [Desulfovibrionaceae bacterium]|nr:hypothetical protein [Desulfovibrionaceae bacterium]
MTSINKKMRENIDAFFDGSTIIGEKIDFINTQRHNPNLSESRTVTVKELTKEQLSEVLKKTNKCIWG